MCEQSVPGSPLPLLPGAWVDAIHLFSNCAIAQLRRHRQWYTYMQEHVHEQKAEDETVAFRETLPVFL